jgi:hypothetical protein
MDARTVTDSMGTATRHEADSDVEDHSDPVCGGSSANSEKLGSSTVLSASARRSSGGPAPLLLLSC